MASRRSYQWPIILSIIFHAAFLAGMVMADLTVEPERLKSAATIINMTMNASEPVIEEKVKEKPEPKQKQKQKQKQKREPEPKKNPVLETVSASKLTPLLEKNIEPVLKETPVTEQKIQEVQQDEQPKTQQSKRELELTQQETTKQEFSTEALIIQEQVIGQQLAEQTADAEIQYQDQILSLIESNKFFSKRAQKMRQEGDVIVSFTLKSDGSIQDLKVLDETAPSLLKKDALKTIRRSALFPPFPVDSARGIWSFQTTLSYKLF
jgi:protein TonB